MKKRTVLIIAYTLLIAIVAFFVIKVMFFSQPEKKDVMDFLTKFNTDLQQKAPESLLGYFNTGQKKTVTLKLLYALAGRQKFKGKDTTLFKVYLHLENVFLKTVDAQITTVNIPVEFNHNTAGFQTSILTFKLRKSGNQSFSIIKVNARNFYSDYTAYQNKVELLLYTPEDIFGKLTLAAFKTAQQLKTKFDSIIWFQHVDKQTYYYVVKGKWNIWALDSVMKKSRKSDWKMGLVSPQLNEVIPAEYDLIHNIGATFDGMIEVEKDGKRGFYNTLGKILINPEYDEILPVTDNDNLALLRKDDDYFYFKKDSTITPKLDGFSIASAIKTIRGFADNFTLLGTQQKSVMEYNDQGYNSSILIPPSYLADWAILPIRIDFIDPLRTLTDDDGDIEADASYAVKFTGHAESSNWFESAFYNIVNDYLGTRGGLYNSKSMLLIDKKQNRIHGFNVPLEYQNQREGGPQFSGKCNENSLVQLSDSLFQLKVTADVETELPSGKYMTEAPYYHYLRIINGKIETLPNNRYFSFTKYEKMDESYLHGCYVVDGRSVDHLTKEMLEYAKNEIFAEYHYKFKSPVWTRIFNNRFNRYDDANNTNVNDSLTVVDKYNINFINQKLKGVKPPPSTLAAN